MIFKQWELVLNGQKTQTRRLWHDTDYTWQTGARSDEPHAPLLYSQICKENGRSRYNVGQLLPVIPKRAKPMIWLDRDGQPRFDATETIADIHYDNREAFTSLGFMPARVKVIGLSRERLQNITEADAIAEGVGSVEEYKALWQSINGKTKGAKWEDNPLVTVLMFEMAR